MITTFHLAVYLAYYVWENYVSVLLRHNVDSDNGDGSNRIDNSVSDGGSNCEGTETEPNLPSKQNNAMIIDKSENWGLVDKEEIEQSYKNIMFKEDEGRNIIYNVEPTFECYINVDSDLVRFTPPVYTQRYMVISKVLQEPCWAESIKKVVDFGCAELSFEVKYLKKLHGIEEIVAVDVDSDTLSQYICRASPTATEYLDRRPSPLTIKVYCGSVAHTNEALANTDAVIAIELIEHLFPGDLECLPFTIFGFIKPKLAMFTTPNSDFNVLLPLSTSFRHWDHKFEWTRQQFEDWGNNLVQRYPAYNVTYQGIGPGPVGTEHLGCCSQMATFIKTHDHLLPEHDMDVQSGPYKLIDKYDFPYHIETRTREEIIRDEALSFIIRWKMLSKTYDAVNNLQIPLKCIMERIKCHNREKLKTILAKENFEVTTNENGHEVVLIPEDNSEDDLFSELSDIPDDESVHVDCSDVLNRDAVFDENWDVDEDEPKVQFNSTTIGDGFGGSAAPEENTSIMDSLSWQLDETPCIESVICSHSGNDSFSDTVVPDVNSACNSYQHKNNAENIGDKENVVKSVELDYSVYETPYNNRPVVKPSCESVSPFVQSLYYQSNVMPGDVCNRVLSFDNSDAFIECNAASEISICGPSSEHKKIDSFFNVSKVVSPFDASIYATPCCSQIHKNNIPKCLSLQEINAHYGSPVMKDSSPQAHTVFGEQRGKSSKSMDGFKSQESYDMHETCSNGSRVVDSGYPDSYSEHNMDMDLTPEQFDDIETESEGNDVSSRSVSPPLPPPQPIPRVIDDVENGDVANNNRDGEGNNMVAEMEEEPLQFEAQIQEVYHEVPNLAVGQQFQFGRRNSMELYQDMPSKCSCTSLEVCVGDKNVVCPLSSPDPKALVTEISTAENQACDSSECAASSNGSIDERDNKSPHSSVITGSSSWSHLDVSDSTTCFNKLNSNEEPPKLKTHDSLSTVLEGKSKFSDCSLVCPIFKDDNFTKLAGKVDCSDNILLLSTESAVEATGTSEGDIENQDSLSVQSLYHSASSDNSVISEHEEESTAFPKWLLDIQTSDTDENDVESLNVVPSNWDFDSNEELVILNYDVQVDARGGGDIDAPGVNPS